MLEVYATSIKFISKQDLIIIVITVFMPMLSELLSEQLLGRGGWPSG